jgi:hypothetical protein
MGSINAYISGVVDQNLDLGESEIIYMSGFGFVIKFRIRVQRKFVTK